jgi:inhibitor of cysteine peptidase
MKMKKNRILLITLTTIALTTLVSSCAAPAARKIDIDCDAFYDLPDQVDRIDVSGGDTLTVTLCSNPTTGYTWGENAVISSGEVIRQDRQEFNAPSSGGDAPVVGAAGTHTWTFSALQAGESVITFAYSQPWEGGEKNTWTVTLTVVVK